ncbi:unnamed protein product [Agarophyton chilense]
MVAMSENGVKQLQNSELITQLLSDISPEQAVRWIMLHGIQKKHVSKRTIPHIIARSLLSIVIRAPSVAEARSARDALSILLSTPQEHDASALGFSGGETTTFVANILVDMLSSATQDEPLQLTAPTLSFYSEAGAGSGDTEEFYKATPEHRVLQTFSHETLPDIRQFNLAMAINTFAEAFKEKGCRRRLLEVTRSNMHRILAPWLSILPSTISQLDSTLLNALLSFYSSLVSALTEDEQSDLVTRLVSSTMQIIQTSPEQLFYFLDGISVNSLKVSMCRLCLIQRFRVVDDDSKLLTARAIVNKYLTLKPVQGRANNAVPVLLTVLIDSWIKTLPQKKMTPRFLGRKSAGYSLKCLKKLSIAKREFLERYNDTLEDDMLAFNMAIQNLSLRIFVGEDTGNTSYKQRT